MIWSNNSYMYICHIAHLQQNYFLHCIHCISSLVFDIFTDVCINCANSTSNFTSILKRLIFKKVWNLVWAFLLPVSWHLTPFPLNKLCCCIFSLPFSSDNTCQSAPLPSSSLHKLCSRLESLFGLSNYLFRCRVWPFALNGCTTNLAHSENCQTVISFFSSQAYWYLKKAALKHAQTTRHVKNNTVFRFDFILENTQQDQPMFVVLLDCHHLWWSIGSLWFSV